MANIEDATVKVEVGEVRVVVCYVAVIALVKIAGAVAVGMFWALILMKWFG